MPKRSKMPLTVSVLPSTFGSKMTILVWLTEEKRRPCIRKNQWLLSEHYSKVIRFFVRSALCLEQTETSTALLDM